MIVSGEMSVAVGREELWAVLSDPQRRAQALPGVSYVTIEDEQHFSAVAHPFTALGEPPVALEFEIVEVRAGEFVAIAATGSAGENLLTLTLSLELASTAEGTSDGSATRRAYSAGFSMSASMPPEMRFRVVSFPATARSRKNASNSISVRPTPSTSALMRTLTRSSPLRSLAAAISLAYIHISIAA